jgi:hypothetical protein
VAGIPFLPALFGLAAVFWLGLGYRVNRDARRRIRDPFRILVATVLGLVPPYVGPLVYLLFRPAETLADITARQAELWVLEREISRARPVCPECSFPIEPGYVACPVCTMRVRRPCARCDAPLEPLWQMCPYCATPVETPDLDADAALTAEARELAAGAFVLDPEPRTADL